MAGRSASQRLILWDACVRISNEASDCRSVGVIAMPAASVRQAHLSVQSPASDQGEDTAGLRVSWSSQLSVPL